MDSRISHEKKVVDVMITMYCHRWHGLDHGVCDACAALRQYAFERLERCPKGSAKPSCRRCEIHCYSPVIKLRIKEVMRYAGPRMIYTHPVMAIRHLFSELK